MQRRKISAAHRQQLAARCGQVLGFSPPRSIHLHLREEEGLRQGPAAARGQTLRTAPSLQTCPRVPQLRAVPAWDAPTHRNRGASPLAARPHLPPPRGAAPNKSLKGDFFFFFFCLSPLSRNAPHRPSPACGFAATVPFSDSECVKSPNPLLRRACGALRADTEPRAPRPGRERDCPPGLRGCVVLRTPRCSECRRVTAEQPSQGLV